MIAYLQQATIHYGITAIFIILFAESSLIFFLPGDSFLFVAGILAAQGYLPVGWALLLGFIGATLGNNLGYYLGKKFGPRIFSRENSWLFNKTRIEEVRTFYDRYGALTLIIARFVPAIRTIAPIAGGIAKMNYRIFFSYNIIGAFLWVLSMLFAGYFLGRSVPNIDHYVLPIIGVVIVISIIPGLISYLRTKKN